MNDIAQNLPQIMAAYLVYLIAVISPGPAIMAIVSTSIARGRAAGLTMAAGVFTGSFTWAMAASFGLAALLTHYAQLLQFLKIAGGLYLLYLAYRALRSALRKAEVLPNSGKTSPRTLVQTFLLGYAIHLTNPKAIFAWLAIISIGLPAHASIEAVGFIVGGCLATGMTVFAGYALLFSTAGALAVYRKARRGIEGTMALLFGVAGIRLLTAQL